uniref:J domain-containing protein n=1 Tax=Trieres chinensis TaxID=1514140 RepID=A0A6U1ZV61_TRICV
MSSDEAAADDLSGLSGFFFYVFIVHPATAWILRPGRFEKKKSIMYAIGFLAALASIKTGLEMQARGPNHYQLLGVTRASNPLEIKRAYKKLSLQLHPDKNTAPDASERFDEVKKSYDVLMDMELREVYNKFGPEGIASNKRFDETQFFIELGVFYITWGMMVFVLTLGKKSGDARQWCFTGMIVMLVCEIAIMTARNNPLPKELFPTSTEHEVVWLMHSLFPAFMNGCRSLGAFLFIDLDAQARQLLLALQEQNKDILLVLRDVQIGVQTIQAHGGGGGGAGRLAGSGAATTAGLPAQGAAPITRATPTGKIKELQERLQNSNTSVVKAVDDLKSEGQKSSSFGFYAMIMGYIAFSYLFSNN